MLYNLIAFSAAVATGAADADCVGYFYKINGVCTGVQQFPGATGCGLAKGGKDSHPIALDRAFCEEFGTARDTADQQVPMVSWGNLGKAGAATFAGEVNDPSMPSGCVTHASQNIYQWNNAANGAVAGWWRPVCMTDEQPAPPPTSPPTAPRTFTKCKQYTLDRAMSVKNGANSEAVQLCKVINGNVMSPMWGNGKDSDCGTDATLIAASTSSIADCQALCDAHSKCVGWQMWDQNRLTPPRDDQGCYLFEHGTADQLVPDRVFGDNSAVAAGVCFPEPRTFTKCKEYTPNRAMSIKNGANSEAVQLCKVINGNAMSPMWGNGKNSDCGTDAALITASTNSIADCQALCDAHAKCLGWWMWDQSRNVPPYQKDDQGCYLFEHGTSDQLVPDRVFGDNSAVAAGVCFPEPRTFTKCKEYTPDRAMSIKNGANSEAVQLCKVINGNALSPMWGNGKNSDCGTDAGLIAASTNSIADCQALCDAHVKCLGWWMWDQSRNAAPFNKDDQGCYLFEHGTADQLVPDRVFGDNSAVAAGVCFPATAPPSAVLTAPPSAVLTAPPSAATAPPTATVTQPANCQTVMLKAGSMCLHDQGNNASAMWVTCPAPNSADPKFKFDIVPVDPSNPNVVKIRNSRGQFLSYQSPWQDSVMTRNWMPIYDQAWELRTTTSGGVQFYNPVRAAFLAATPSANNGFAGFVTATSGVATTFDASSGGCAVPPPPTKPPTEPPTMCNCRQSDKTYAEGSRCLGPLNESIGYRKTANWCCSDYGCSKGYKWVNPSESPCHDDDFVGTCVFNFIAAGGCDMTSIDANTAIKSVVDESCFECPHIGNLIDEECKSPTTGQNPIDILNDMIDDARRLEQAPLPAGDAKLQKINRKISKIRTILKQTKLASKAALHDGSG